MLLNTLLLAVVASILPGVEDPTLVNSTPAVINGHAYAVCTYSNGQVTVEALEGGKSYLVRRNAESCGLFIAAPPTPDRQQFVSRWTDVAGIEHEVVTPIMGTMETTRHRALRRHRAAVEIMREAFPPVSVQQGGSGMALLRTLPSGVPRPLAA